MVQARKPKADATLHSFYPPFSISAPDFTGIYSYTKSKEIGKRIEVTSDYEIH